MTTHQLAARSLTQATVGPPSLIVSATKLTAAWRDASYVTDTDCAALNRGRVDLSFEKFHQRRRVRFPLQRVRLPFKRAVLRVR